MQTLERGTALQARLVGDLFDVSQAIAGTLDVVPQPIYLAAIVPAPPVIRQPVSGASADGAASSIAPQAS